MNNIHNTQDVTSMLHGIPSWSSCRQGVQLSATPKQPKETQHRTFYLQRKWVCPMELASPCLKAVAHIYAPFLASALPLCGIKQCRCLNHGWMNL